MLHLQPWKPEQVRGWKAFAHFSCFILTLACELNKASCYFIMENSGTGVIICPSSPDTINSRPECGPTGRSLCVVSNFECHDEVFVLVECMGYPSRRVSSGIWRLASQEINSKLR